MYRVVIIDDDRWALQDIKQSFCFSSWNFEVVKEYLNAEAALPFICQDHPDLVISDIRMGQMNGLEFIHACKEKGLDAIYVIVSGYDDFNYVQDAFRYGVFNYLLKPLDDAKVTQLMKSVIAKLAMLRPSIQESAEKTDSINQAIEYMNAHFAESMTLDQVADHVFLINSVIKYQ